MGKLKLFNLVSLFTVGALVFIRVWGAIAAPNILWPDEIFQTLEQAHRLVYGYGTIPWEFQNGTRSWLLPGALAGLIYPVSLFSQSSTAYIEVVYVVLSILSLSLPLVAFFWAKDLGYGPWFCLLAAFVCGIWFEFVYFAPKAFYEVIATYFLVNGVYFLLLKPSTRASDLAKAGLLLGVALVLRIHFAPMIAFVVILKFVRDRAAWRTFVRFFLGPVVFCGILDWFTWGMPFASFVRNFSENLIVGVANNYGTEAWHYYFSMYFKNFGWFGMICLLFAILDWKRSWVLLVSALIVYASHSLIDHKEFRFVFPADALVFLAASVGMLGILKRFSVRWQRVFAVFVFVGCVGSSYHYSIKFPYWQRLSTSVSSYKYISSLGDVCGLGVGTNWSLTGGSYLLHKNIFVQHFDLEPEFNARKYNYVFNPLENLPQEYREVKCWKNQCLYKRDGECLASE